jgi:hypothetical protein
MLNARLYRAALIPILVALAIAAFSLSGRGGGLSSGLPPDAFSAGRAFGSLQELAVHFPNRRPGSRGDEALAHEVAATIEGLGGSAGGGFTVHVHRFEGQTIDGERTLTTVVAERPGSTEATPILIVAHRDAAARGSQAELSGTAALLELARVFSSRETKRTIVLASTSGGSGGDAGAADLASSSSSSGPFDAALVLGDVAGTAVRRPVVVPYSDGFGANSATLEHTVSDALSREAATGPGEPSTLGQLAHLAFPLAPGEEGVLGAHGVPSVLLQASGERGPAPGAAVSQERLEGFGRAALSAVDALDSAPDISASTQTGLQLQRKTLPEWALRLLLGALLLGPLLLLVDGFARLRRRRQPVGRWTLWALSCALPFLACALFSYLLGALSLARALPVPAVGAGAPFDARAASSVAAVALVFVLSWLLWGLLMRRLRWPLRPDPEVAGLSILLVLGGVCTIAWIANPYSALLILPALELWLLLASPQLRPRRAVSLLLLALGVAPLGLLIAFYARQLGLGPGGIAWAAVELLAGWHVGLGAALLWSLALGCGVAMTALTLSASAPQQAPPPEVEVTIRGPLSYAGPGSLGGTESALRR